MDLGETECEHLNWFELNQYGVQLQTSLNTTMILWCHRKEIS
jgi:hypothetical protein